MAVGYSVRLRIVDSESETPTAVATIAKVVSNWAGIDDFAVTGRQNGLWLDSSVRIRAVYGPLCQPLLRQSALTN
jgi:hypothetical protein